MDTFITGATGHIGFAVAKAMRRAGHKVWGLTRSEAKADMLARHEIHPVIGDMDQPDTFMEIAKQCSVLIHAAADYQHDTVELDHKTIDAFLEAGHHGAQPKTIIYTSGCWVNGDTGTDLVDETTPLNPIEAVLWRPEHEQMILEADHVKGIVIRPGCIYGGQGGLTGDWFEGAEKGNMEIVGDGNNIWTMVHVEDNADAYVRAAESGLSGEVFNISDRSRWSVGDMAEAAARVAGYDEAITCIPEEEAAEELGSMAEALAVNQHVDSRKAVRLLGWQPNHGGFVDDVESYYAAWKAHQK